MDGQRPDDVDGTEDGTDGRTEDDDGTETTVRTDDIYSSKLSITTLGPIF